ncbi:DUF6959 family protein [Dactylosporangium siamense]|uniref:Uncharacterized protein n=1 Tax=Dactylosporangium siamense TaxID=685454 RepID=A0A919UA48_9ACTN|nr:hypothetical protein [Dactylosporangium siamense]GIG44081.1 hypothetical protein Dsi01nite_021220 [Dactylosporangium siamense]
MARVEVEMMTGQHNYAVLRLPGRRFPGVLVQGDSLSILSGEVQQALDLLRAGDTAAAEEELAYVANHLAELVDGYVRILDAAGMPLPFQRPA